jgi:hypothetical protein
MQLTRDRRRRRIPIVRLVAPLVVALGLVLVLVSQAFAYNGEYCYNIWLDSSNGWGCLSNPVTHVRRARGHDAGHGYVGLYPPVGPAYITNACPANGCTADTGYYQKDVNATGALQMYATGEKAGYGYGWMYP